MLPWFVRYDLFVLAGRYFVWFGGGAGGQVGSVRHHHLSACSSHFISFTRKRVRERVQAGHHQYSMSESLSQHWFLAFYVWNCFHPCRKYFTLFILVGITANPRQTRPKPIVTRSDTCFLASPRLQAFAVYISSVDLFSSLSASFFIGREWVLLHSFESCSKVIL